MHAWLCQPFHYFWRRNWMIYEPLLNIIRRVQKFHHLERKEIPPQDLVILNRRLKFLPRQKKLSEWFVLQERAEFIVSTSWWGRDGNTFAQIVVAKIQFATLLYPNRDAKVSILAKNPYFPRPAPLYAKIIWLSFSRIFSPQNGWKCHTHKWHKKGNKSIRRSHCFSLSANQN